MFWFLFSSFCVWISLLAFLHYFCSVLLPFLFCFGCFFGLCVYKCTFSLIFSSVRLSGPLMCYILWKIRFTNSFTEHYLKFRSIYQEKYAPIFPFLKFPFFFRPERFPCRVQAALICVWRAAAEDAYSSCPVVDERWGSRSWQCIPPSELLVVHLIGVAVSKTNQADWLLSFQYLRHETIKSVDKYLNGNSLFIFFITVWSQQNLKLNVMWLPLIMNELLWISASCLTSYSVEGFINMMIACCRRQTSSDLLESVQKHHTNRAPKANWGIN